MNTKISIVTVCYNAEQEIQKTIHSVLSQNYDNIIKVIAQKMGSKYGTPNKKAS